VRGDGAGLRDEVKFEDNFVTNEIIGFPWIDDSKVFAVKIKFGSDCEGLV